VGTHAFFQLSSMDAGAIAQALDGGKPLAERLKNLSQRHCILKSGADRWAEVLIPAVHEPRADYTDLLTRSRSRWARVRTEIERDIEKRQSVVPRDSKETLDGWE